MYNDYGSIARDRGERNVNSVNFPEFAGGAKEGRQKALFALAEYERVNMQRGLARLGDLTGQDKRQLMERVRMFCNVTDLYGQIYVARDIASRM